MDPLAHKYTYFQRLWHRWQARRDIPFRRKFFVGYDLAGNTYWEFTIDGNVHNLRRKLEPYVQLPFKVDHYHTVPPQWHQWLRRTRPTAPTIQELVNDQIRQERIKLLAQQADRKWLLEKEKQQQAFDLELQHELRKAEQRKVANAASSGTVVVNESAQRSDETGTNDTPTMKKDTSGAAQSILTSSEAEGVKHAFLAEKAGGPDRDSDTLKTGSQQNPDQSTHKPNPWAQADKNESDLSSASVKPRR